MLLFQQIIKLQRRIFSTMKLTYFAFSHELFNINLVSPPGAISYSLFLKMFKQFLLMGINHTHYVSIEFL